jgi:two-component system, OmpR family, KDP operon response regulator KdpE
MSTPTPVALVLEDEREFRQFVRISLEAEGWQVHEAGTLKQGLIEAGTRRPDLIIADLGLPDGDGVDFIRQVRTWSAVPIIVLSARTQESGKVAALDAGADDYITKPFGVNELLARTRASLRRMRVGQAPADAVFGFGDVEVDRAARIVKKRGVEVHLTPIEYRLLGVLVANAGRVMTHPHLLREVWGPTHSRNTHYLRVYMGNLRQKLEDDSAQPRHIVTETGVGYRLLTE